MTVQIEVLRAIPYFADLGAEELESVKKMIVERTAERGKLLFLDGEPAHALYILVSGVVKLFKTSVDGKEQIFEIITPGKSFNEVAVFDNGLTPIAAQAMGTAILYEIDRNSLIVLMRKYPIIGDNVIKVLAWKVRNLVELVEDLSFRTVVGRVAKILSDNATDGKSAGAKLTQQEMAAMAGTAREVVGRSLKAMEEQGIIVMDRHRIIIKNREALKKMVSAI